MKRKVIAFDMDGTLAPSKSPLPDRMESALAKLLDNYHVCVISGGKYELFERQLLGRLRVEPEKLSKLHLMPTCGTRYYNYDQKKQNWELVYAEDLTDTDKKKITQVLKDGAEKLGLQEDRIYGEIIEDRGSQISWSAYGQEIVEELGEEGLQMKEDWDPDNSKKQKFVEYAAPLLPDFEVRGGGTTTIDVTKKGIDKAYGMQKLTAVLNIPKEQIFFIGDRIYEGGNDYPVKTFGVDTLQVATWEETAVAVEAICQVS